MAIREANFRPLSVVLELRYKEGGWNSLEGRRVVDAAGKTLFEQLGKWD